MKTDGPLTLTDFAGTHVLDARGEYVGGINDHRSVLTDGDARVVVLRLDGQLFEFREDPSDGYRSMLGEIRAVGADSLPGGALASFLPVVVTIHAVVGESTAVIVGISERTGLALFEIGSTELDDYYPSFTSSWTPDGERSRFLPHAEDE